MLKSISQHAVCVPTAPNGTNPVRIAYCDEDESGVESEFGKLFTSSNKSVINTDMEILRKW